MPPDVSLTDTAITKPEDDRLGRATFAKRLANALLSWQQEDSIVIGLFGPWGSGKTSVVNMALSYLDSATSGSAKEEGPIVVKFNPWHFSDQGHLLGLFFGELLQGIRKKAPQAFKMLKKNLAKLGEVLSSADDIPLVGGYAKLGAGIARALAPEASLTELRGEADRVFRDLGRRVIIVMDDVDRLTQQEIRQLFQLIKLNANFPNTVYLIAADRSVVEKSLDTAQGVSGRAYLEKIVQAAFDVPLPDASRITSILHAGLNEALAVIPNSEWDDSRWSSLYHNGFRDLFMNLRDVKRFLGTLSITLPMICSEVNPVDFVGLEAIRVFAPDAYAEIGKRRFSFLGQEDWSLLADNIEKKRSYQEIARADFEQVISLAGTKQRAIRGICIQLFPATAPHQTGVTNSHVYRDQWRAERRICSPDIFDRYYLLGVPADDISQLELGQVIDLASSSPGLLALFAAYAANGRFVRLTDWLPEVADRIPESTVLSLCLAVLTVIEEFTDERRSVTAWGPTSQLAGVVSQALHRLTPDQRCRWLHEQIVSGERLYALLNQVSREATIQARSPGDPFASVECLQKLKEAIIEQLRARAQSGQLRGMKNLLGVLVTWKRWTPNPGEVDQYVAGMITTPEGALDFVADCLYEIEILAGATNPPSVHWSLNLDNLGELTDLRALESLLLQAHQRGEELSDRQKLALEVFNRQTQRQGARDGADQSPGDNR